MGSTASIHGRLDSHFENDLHVIVHHYVATVAAKTKIDLKLKQVHSDHPESNWLPNLQLTYGLVLPDSVRVSSEGNPEFYDIVERYYDHSIYNDHFRLSGVEHAKLGFPSVPTSMRHFRFA